MNSEKRCFEIAIQRFKHIDLKFAMEDVPDELAKRMIQKLDLKKGDTVCDWCCKGIGLLKNIPTGHKLYARVEDKRTELIVKKLLPNVNIFKDTTMNFDHIIMNPPYDKNLHLKILSEAMKHSDEVVNLSPIRWLQDPLAEYKKNSDFKKFYDIRKRIETLDVVCAAEAQQLFGSGQYENLGIYKLTKVGGANIIQKPFISQALFDKVNLPTYQGKHKSLYDAAQKPNFEKPYVKMSYFHGHVGAKDWADIISPQKELAFSTNTSTGTFTVNFDTQEEAENFFAYCQTKFVKACNGNVKTNIRWPGYAIPFMTTYEHPWTDADLYDYFKLTEDEIKEIEQSIS